MKETNALWDLSRQETVICDFEMAIELKNGANACYDFRMGTYGYHAPEIKYAEEGKSRYSEVNLCPPTPPPYAPLTPISLNSGIRYLCFWCWLCKYGELKGDHNNTRKWLTLIINVLSDVRDPNY